MPEITQSEREDLTTARKIARSGNKNHFLALVCFNGKINDPEQLPDVWIIPSPKIEAFTRSYKTGTGISRALINEDGDKYKNAWSQID